MKIWLRVSAEEEPYFGGSSAVLKVEAFPDELWDSARTLEELLRIEIDDLNQDLENVDLQDLLKEEGDELDA